MTVPHTGVACGLSAAMLGWASRVRRSRCRPTSCPNTALRLRGRSLTSMGLAGTLPASLTQLTRLQNLCAALPPSQTCREQQSCAALPVSAFTFALSAGARALERSRNCAVSSRGALRRLRGRNLTGNAIAGSLPPEWGWESALIQLQTVSLEGNRLSGSLPETYGRPGAWAGLQALVLDNNQLTGAAGGCLWRCLGYLYLFLSSTVTLVVAGDCASTPQLEWGRDARCRSEPGAAMRRCWPPVVVGLRPYRP